jgi:phosphoglycolate phosphatase
VRVAALVFDLDGTLVDSRRDLATAVNRMRADLGLPPLAVAAVVSMVGEGARTLVRRAVGAEIGPDRLEAAFAAFLRHYGEVCLDETRPYPGIREALARLAARWPLAVLTDKPEALSRRILDGLELSVHFAAVLGGDSLPTLKPDPAGLLHLAAHYGAAPGELLLVGDSAIDEATARAAGCPFALVEWGFPSPEKASLRADLRAATPRHLLELLEGREWRGREAGGAPAGKL